MPYCVSHSVPTDANPTLALADVQSRLPGIRCGERCGFVQRACWAEAAFGAPQLALLP